MFWHSSQVSSQYGDLIMMHELLHSFTLGYQAFTALHALDKDLMRNMFFLTCGFLGVLIRTRPANLGFRFLEDLRSKHSYHKFSPSTAGPMSCI